MYMFFHKTFPCSFVFLFFLFFWYLTAFLKLFAEIIVNYNSFEHMLSKTMCFTMIYAKSFKNTVTHPKNKKQKNKTTGKGFVKNHIHSRVVVFLFFGVSHEPSELAEVLASRLLKTQK